jgi:hypothetical protein
MGRYVAHCKHKNWGEQAKSKAVAAAARKLAVLLIAFGLRRNRTSFYAAAA